MKKNIEQFIKILIYSSFFIPLVIVPNSFIFPFIVPKVLLLRSIIFLMIGAYIALLLINWKYYKPKFTLLNVLLGLFLISFVISTFVGSDPYHSFWDNHERMLGLFTITHYIAYYFVASAVFKSWKEWKWALRIFLIAGSGVMMIAALQAVNPDFLLNQGSDRSASTLGNAIYVGGYGLFLVFVAVLLLLKEEVTSWRYVEIVLGILALLGLFFSGTRGSLIGLLVGVVVAIVCYSFILKDFPRLRKVLWGCIILGVVATGVLYLNRQTTFVKGIPAVGRILNTSLQDISHSPRSIAWSIGVESWKEKPIFGWGPNNFFYAFNKYYHPESLEFGYPETWFDNAHNILVNTLTVQGLFGLVVYLGIFIGAIWSLVVAMRRKEIDPHSAVIASAFLIAHLVQNVTVFENPTSYLYFMLWLAFINQSTQFLLRKKQDSSVAQTGDKKIGLISLVSLGAVGILGIIIFNVQPARANMKTLSALRQLQVLPEYTANQATASTAAFVSTKQTIQEALLFSSPHIDDIRSDIGRAVAMMFEGQGQALPAKDKIELFNTIYPELQKNTDLHPLDIRNQLYLAQLAQFGANIMNNAAYVTSAESYLEDALKKSPRRQQLIYSLAFVKLQINKIPESIALLEGAIKDNSKISESYWRLAYVYSLSNKPDKMNEVFELAKKNGVTFSSQEQAIINQFVTQKNTTEVKTK